MGLSISWTSGSLKSDVYIEILRRIGIGQTKAPLKIIKQLKEGGRLIVPVGNRVGIGTQILATKRKVELEV